VDLLFDILGVILLLLACGALLIVLALTMPVRIGIEAHGNQRTYGGSGSLRLFGGVFGVGARADRSKKRDSGRLRLTIGLMIYRWFLPVYRKVLGDDGTIPVEPASTTPTPAQQPPRTEGSQIEVPPTEGSRTEESHLDVGLSKKPEHIEPPIQQADTTAEPSDEHNQAESASAQKQSTPIQTNATAAYEPLTATEVRGTADQSEPQPSGTVGKLEQLRNARDEWWPVVRGSWRRLSGIIRIRRFYVDGTIGLDDPALTGQVAGFALSLRGLNAPTGILAILGIDRGALRINVEPVFEQFTLAGRIESEWRVSLRRIWSAAIYVGWILLRRKLSQRKRNNEPNTNDHIRVPGGYEPSKN
jgi:hypothetical protein